MEELGYLDDPADRLGMLDGQRMRAARVVLDIGVHLGKPDLDGEGTADGWDHDYALAFLRRNVNMTDEFVHFEVNRYLGWPGQAPSYKVGQRIWEQIRDEAQQRDGADFSFKDFHKRALDLGGVGLDTSEVGAARLSRRFSSNCRWDSSAKLDCRSRDFLSACHRRKQPASPRRWPSFCPYRSIYYMTTATTAPAAKQVAINDIGSAEDFLAAVEKTLKFFNDGDLIEGIVVKIDRDEVLLDVGYKTEGVIPSRELSIKHDVDPV